MPDISFNVGGDAANFVRTSQEVLAGQEKMERGWEHFAQSAEAASAKVQQSLRDVETYELASAQRIQAQISTSGSARASRVRPFDLAPAAVAAGQTVVHPGKDVQPLELAATSANLAANRNYNQWLTQEASAREKAAKESQLLSESISNSAAVDRAAHQVRGEAQSLEDSLNQNHLDAFGARMDKQRSDAGHLRTPDWWKNNPGLKDKLGLAATGAGVVGLGMYALGSTLEKVSETYDRIGNAGIQFEDEMRGLLSLGNNISVAPQLRDQVLALSGATGQSAGDIAAARFKLESAGGNLSPETRQQIISSALTVQNVAGGDLQTDVAAVTKLMQTYGQEMGNANMAGSKLLATEEKSALSLQELAQLLPDILPAAKMMGHTYDEVASSVITATQVMGNNEKTMTALRNTFLKLGDAQAEGLVHQGTLIDQLHELEGVDPESIKRIFGERTVTLVAALAAHTGDVAKNLQDMQKVTADEGFQKSLKRMLDPGARDADTLKGVKETGKNIDTLRYLDPATRKADLEYNLIKNNLNSHIDPSVDALLPNQVKEMYVASQRDNVFSHVWKGVTSAFSPLGGVGSSLGGKALENPENVALGDALVDMRRQATVSGDKEAMLRADVSELEFGKQSGTFVMGPGGQKRFTGDSDAQGFLEYKNQYTTATKRDYLEHEGFVERGDTKGDADLAKHLREAAEHLAAQAKSNATAAAAHAKMAQRFYGGPAGEDDTNTHIE